MSKENIKEPTDKKKINLKNKLKRENHLAFFVGFVCFCGKIP